MNNRQIAIAAVRQCTAQRYAENAQAHAQALHEAADRYLADLGAISHPDLQAIRTLRYDADRASIDARYANLKARYAMEAVDRAIRSFDARDPEGASL